MPDYITHQFCMRSTVAGAWISYFAVAWDPTVLKSLANQVCFHRWIRRKDDCFISIVRLSSICEVTFVCGYFYNNIIARFIQSISKFYMGVISSFDWFIGPLVILPWVWERDGELIPFECCSRLVFCYLLVLFQRKWVFVGRWEFLLCLGFCSLLFQLCQYGLLR